VASSLQETVLVLYYHMIYVKNTNTFKRAGAGGLSSRDGTSLLFFFFFLFILIVLFNWRALASSLQETVLVFIFNTYINHTCKYITCGRW